MELLGRPKATVERTLGRGRRLVDVGGPKDGIEIVDGASQEVVAYGPVSILYADGRARSFTREFGRRPDLSWKEALALSGIPARGVSATPDGGTLRLSGGSIPKGFFATYTGGMATIAERTLVVAAPKGYRRG